MSLRIRVMSDGLKAIFFTSGLSGSIMVPFFRIHTRHRDTRDLRSWPLSLINVCGCCVVNMAFFSIVVSQKENLSLKKWHVPRAPWHSMNGFGRNSCRHDPIEDEKKFSPVNFPYWGEWNGSENFEKSEPESGFPPELFFQKSSIFSNISYRGVSWSDCLPRGVYI